MMFHLYINFNGKFVWPEIKIQCQYRFFSLNFNCAWRITSEMEPWDHLKNAYELLNLNALKFSLLYKIQIFQCMGMIFSVEFQRVPLKFHTKYLTFILNDMFFLYNVEILRALRFKSLWAFKKTHPSMVCNRPFSQIPQCISKISYNAPLQNGT